jgi:hypothetical protein
MLLACLVIHSQDTLRLLLPKLFLLFLPEHYVNFLVLVAPGCNCAWEDVPTIFLALTVHVTLVCWFVDTVYELRQPKTSRAESILRVFYYFAGPRPVDPEIFGSALNAFYWLFWFSLLFYRLDLVVWVQTLVKYNLVFTVISTTYL